MTGFDPKRSLVRSAKVGLIYWGAGVIYRGARFRHGQTRMGDAYGHEKGNQSKAAEGAGKKTDNP